MPLRKRRDPYGGYGKQKESPLLMTKFDKFGKNWTIWFAILEHPVLVVSEQNRGRSYT
jgi:hypothetical protein